MKLFCSVLSLPFPPKFSFKYDDESVPDYLEKNDIQKLLLIGCDGSGMSTVFKQVAGEVSINPCLLKLCFWFFDGRALLCLLNPPSQALMHYYCVV